MLSWAIDMETLDLAITPLSPLHLGTGTVYDPTRYVIREDVLFQFIPESLPLFASERQNLVDAVNKPGLRAISEVQAFFGSEKIANRCVALACHSVFVSSGIASEYKRRLGSPARSGDGSNTIKRLEIMRTAYAEHAGFYIIPGTSIKGALRTAWLDKLVSESRRPGQYSVTGKRGKSLDEKGLLGGGFSADPFRLLKVGDALGAGTVGKVVFSLNKRRPAADDSRKNRQTARCEVISAGQYQSLRFSLRLASVSDEHRRVAELLARQDPKHKSAMVPGQKHCLPSHQALFRAANTYYEKRLREELSLLGKCGYANDQWIRRVYTLLDELRSPLATGEVVLLRVGRYCGSDSITVEQLRHVNVAAPGDAKKYVNSGSTTIWLAGADESSSNDLLPFGWAIAEVANTCKKFLNNDAIEGYCSNMAAGSESALNAAKEKVLQRTGHCIEQIQADVKKEMEVERLAAEEKAQAEHEEQVRQQQRAELISSLSAQKQEAESLRAALTNHRGGPEAVGGALYNRVKSLVDSALAKEAVWSLEDRQYLAEVVESCAYEKISFSRRTLRNIKATILQLREE